VKPRFSRRNIVAASMASASAVLAKQRSVTQTEVSVKTPDGVCDAVLTHPSHGSHPGVLMWPDSGGLRDAFRELARKIAAEGFVVLLPNHLYRTAHPPIFPAGFDPPNRQADREFYSRVTSSFFAAGAIERDATAYTAFLDAQPQVKKRKKLGVVGYCLGGMCVMKTAALSSRIGAGVSLHGGPLISARPDSPHLSIPKMRARFYFAVAANDDSQDPTVKVQLRDAFAKARLKADIQVFPDALHGWCVPDSSAYANKPAVDLAWTKTIALLRSAL
jgi:carboxymethylenebutenolidase